MSWLLMVGALSLLGVIGLSLIVPVRLKAFPGVDCGLGSISAMFEGQGDEHAAGGYHSATSQEATACNTAGAEHLVGIALTGATITGVAAVTWARRKRNAVATGH